MTSVGRHRMTIDGEADEDRMSPLAGKNVVVIGGSRGVGRQVAKAALAVGARVLVIARSDGPLQTISREAPGIEVMALDATDAGAPARVFDVLQPDVLVLCAGALPPAAPLHQQSWQEFSINWETDVRLAFHFCKEVLTRPLAPGATVVVISSGAALSGSPNTGGYAGAKRTQLFVADYSQKESDRRGLGLRFVSVAPRMIPETELGKHAVAGYSRYLGMSPSDFVQSMASSPTAADVARAVVALAGDPVPAMGKVFIVSGNGMDAVP